MSLLPNLDSMTDEEKLAALESIQNSINKSREIQKKKVAENVNLVLQALKRIEANMLERVQDSAKTVEKRVNSIKDGKDGINGRDGKNGKDGRPGRDGKDGRNGNDGLQGLPGVNGQDGVSVADAHIDFDGALVITLTNGREINVGEVISPDLADNIKVITNGGGTSQAVLDTLASLQTEIDNLIPDQTGNAGKFLTTDGSTLSWIGGGGGLDYQGTWDASTNTPTLTSSTGTNGYYYVVSVSGSTNLDGITTWTIGDWVIFNGTFWQKIDNTDLVTSVNGQSGDVSLTYSDVGAASAAQGALADTALQSFTETDPIYTASSWYTTTNNSTNWNTAYGWGNHATAGYLTSFTETDPVVGAVSGIVKADGAGNISAAVAGVDYLATETYTGTVTSVDLSVPTGLSVSGNPVTSSGTLAVSYAAGYAIPTTTKQSNWDDAYTFTGNFPTQTGHSGEYLTTDGSSLSWSAVDALPDQTGNAGKYLTTDGTDASWATLDTDANTTTKGLYEMANTISTNYTISSGNNAMSAGPITINSGVTVTVPTGSRWVVV